MSTRYFPTLGADKHRSITLAVTVRESTATATTVASTATTNTDTNARNTTRGSVVDICVLDTAVSAATINDTTSRHAPFL